MCYVYLVLYFLLITWVDFQMHVQINMDKVSVIQEIKSYDELLLLLPLNQDFFLFHKIAFFVCQYLDTSCYVFIFSEVVIKFEQVGPTFFSFYPLLRHQQTDRVANEISNPVINLNSFILSLNSEMTYSWFCVLCSLKWLFFHLSLVLDFYKCTKLVWIRK